MVLKISRGRGFGHSNRKTQGSGGAIFNSAALSSFKTAVAERASSPADVLFIGDSITAGFNVFAYGSRWQDKVIQALHTSFPSGATGIAGASYVPSLFSDSPSPWSGTQSYSAQTGTPGGNVYGPGGLTTVLDTSGQSRTYSFTGTSFKLWYPRNAGLWGSATLSIDGGTTPGTNQFTIDGGAAGGTAMVSFTSPALTAQAHTVKLTWLANAAGGFLYSGFTFYNGDEAKGIRSHDCSRQAFKVSDMNGLADRYAPFTNLSLIVIALSTNDYRNQTALATYNANVQTMVSDIRAISGNTNTPVLFVVYTEEGDIATQPIAFASYTAELRAICGTLSKCALIDLGPLGLPMPAKSPTLPIDALGDFDTDRLHPTGTGHTHISSLIATPLIAYLT